MPELLVVAERGDRVANAFVGRCRKRAVAHRRVNAWSLWRTLSPELSMAVDGRTRSDLWDRPVFSRLGALPESGLTRWAEADRAYVSAESQAAYLAHMARHPNAVNRPLPHDFTGLGLRFPDQLALARSCGLRTPAWKFTSELSEAEGFISDCSGTALYRPRCEDVFDFRLASRARLPLRGDTLRSAAMLIEGRRGRPLVSTWACGALWHADAVDSSAVPAGGFSAGLKELFSRSGLRFGQSVGILDAGGYSFYGMTGTPQNRFFGAAGSAVLDTLIDGLQEAK